MLPPRAFIGRQRELDVLLGRLTEAFQGRGGVAMLAGEAGVGKTSLAQRFADQARARDALVLWGACFEGEWQPPYGPWVGAIGGYVRRIHPDRLSRELGAGAGVVAHVVRDVEAALPDASIPLPLGPDAGRLRLFESVAAFLRSAADERPVVVVLDDLQWADPDSLALLRHASRATARARVLVVGTYGDLDVAPGPGPVPETDPVGPDLLADVLGALSREAQFVGLTLSGLSVPEVGEYLARAAEQELPAELVGEIAEETGGNPLHVLELLRFLVEEEAIVRWAGRWSVTRGLSALDVPHGIWQVVRRRVARFPAETDTVLRVAAAFSGVFGLDVLQAVTGLPEEPLRQAIDEATSAGLIHPVAGPDTTCEFAHATLRRALYEELTPERRGTLHRRIAMALERRYAGREVEHAPEMASHYHASSALPGGERGIVHCLAAAERCRAAYAYQRAVTFLRMARDLAEQADPAAREDVVGRLQMAEAEARAVSGAHRS
jgi:predicted ATPase